MFQNPFLTEENLLISNLGKASNFRFCLQKQSMPDILYEFEVTAFGSCILNRLHRLKLSIDKSDDSCLCFEFEENIIRRERQKRKSFLVKCLDCFCFNREKKRLFLNIYFEAKKAELFWDDFEHVIAFNILFASSDYPQSIR